VPPALAPHRGPPVSRSGVAPVVELAVQAFFHVAFPPRSPPLSDASCNRAVPSVSCRRTVSWQVSVDRASTETHRAMSNLFMFIPTDEAAWSSRVISALQSLRPVTCRSAAAMPSRRSRPMDDDGRAPRARDEACVDCAPASRHRAAAARAKARDETARHDSVILARHRSRGARDSCGPRAYRGKQRHGNILDASCRSRALVV